MTNLIGAPRVPTDPTQRPTITGTVRYTRSYAGGAAAGLGTGEYPIRYDWPASGDLLGGTWLLDTGTVPLQAIPLAAARYGQTDTAPEGVLIIAGTIRYPSGAAQAFEVRRLPVETSAGLLDLRVEIAPPAWTTPQQLADLIGGTQAAAAQAQAAAQDAQTATQGVANALAGVNTTVQSALLPVQDALTTTAQVTQDAQDAIASISTINTSLRGLANGGTTAGPNGGLLLTLTEAPASTLPATLSPAPNGGLLLDLGGI